MSALSQWRGEWRHTPPGRLLVRAVRLAGAPREFLVRRSAAAALGPDDEHADEHTDGDADEAGAGAPRRSLPRIDPRTGYVILGPHDIPDAVAHMRRVERMLDRARPLLRARDSAEVDKHRLVRDLSSDALLREEPWLVEFALQDALLVPVCRYLRTIPYLARVSIAVSYHVPDWTEPGAFQRFHVDNDDVTHVKYYGYVRDVDARHGPLSFLPADTSRRVLAALAREGHPVRRTTTFRDEDVYRHCDRSELVSLEGERGTGALVDLSRCLHFGSRVASGHERPVYGLTYLRYHRLHENPSNQFDRATARGDRVREMVLTPPRAYPPGTFYPDALGLVARTRESTATS